MYLNLVSMIRVDRTFEHSKLGQLTCKGLAEGYKNCMNFIDNDSTQQKQCRPFYDLALSCFQCNSNEEFGELLENKLNERRKLLRFLKQNNSKLPELQKQNQQSFFNLFNLIDDEEQGTQQINDFYTKQQQSNKKYL